MKTKYPTIKELAELVRAIKREISDEYRAFEDDDAPGIQLTIGHDPATGDWSYQTGDNSYTGGAYHYPNWAITGVYRSTNSRDTARELINELVELNWQ